MTRVGWLHDQGGVIGGAELTQAELAAAAPDGVQIVECPPGGVADCDLYVIHNCVTYDAKDIIRTTNVPAFKYWNDVGSWLDPKVRELLDTHATPICCSPLQAEYMGLTGAALIPPALDLSRFETAATSVNGDRAGIVSVGSWRNVGKGARRVLEWSAVNGKKVDFYGSGPFAPPGSRPVLYVSLPRLLVRYQTLVYLPMVIEPFGRVVAEAWAAGLELVVNELVGAIHWITEEPDAIRTAGRDFWRTVLDG
jgi:hypothetical protein